MAITLRSTNGSALTHDQMDTNLTSFYVSSSLNGTTLNFYTYGTGSFSATTHSVDLTDFLDNQTLTLVGNTLSIADGNGVILPFFDGDYNSLSNTPTLFDGDYNSLSNLPALFDGDYNSLSNLPALFDGDYNSLSNLPTIPTVPTNVSAFTNDVGYITSSVGTLYTAGTGLTLTGTEFSLTDPHFSGDYADLTNKPTIPTVPTNVSAFTNDAGYITSSVGTLYTAGTGLTLTGTEFSLTDPHFSGDYNDLTNKPTVGLSLVTNDLTLTKLDGTTDVVDLTPYLDEDARAIASGTLDSVTGIVTFTRDDSTTFTLDLSDLLDDTNLVTSVNGANGVVVLDTDDIAEGTTNFYDKTVSIIGQNITVNGTYPNFQITGSSDTVYTHPTINATAGTSTASPSHGGTFDVIDSVTVNSEGHVTAYNTKTVTLPADNNTTYSVATSSTLGLVKIGYTETGQNYPVELSSQKMYVNVPWTDTDTTYTAGNGLGLSGTTFSLDTPGTLSKSSTNGVTANSHTHAITTTTSGAANTIISTDANSEITAANFVTTSDRRLKSEIEPIKDGLDVVRDIIAFEYIKNGQKEAGFIAQDVQEVLPYAVREGEDGYLKMTDRAILAHLHKAVQQLDERLSAIEEKLG